MAAPASASIIKVPCDLIVGPTNLGAPTAYGGTLLGTARDKEFTPNPILRPIFNEVSGTYKDVIYGGERVLFRAVLRYDDADALLNIMPKAISSGSSGVHWLFRPEGTTSNTRAGTSLGASSFKLLVAARARVNHPSMILYNCVPAPDEALRIQLSMGEEYALAFACYCTPDANGRVYDIGHMANLLL